MISPLDFLKRLHNNNDKIYENDQSKKIETAMAILLSYVMLADGKVTQQESDNVKKFYAKELWF